MKRISATLTLLTMSWCCSTQLPLAKPATSGSGKYSAKLEIKALKNERTGRTPQLPFSGKFAHSDGKFRLEVVNDLTTETQVIIVDSAAKQLWMLFPDTLNGLHADLATLDKKDLATQAQGFMTGNYATVPSSWSKPASKPAQLNGKAVTELSYKLPAKTTSSKEQGGGTLTFWHSPDKSPVKILLDSPSMKLTVDFSEVEQGGNPDAKQFKPDTKFKLRELGKGEALPLPGGLPGGLV